MKKSSPTGSIFLHLDNRWEQRHLFSSCQTQSAATSIPISGKKNWCWPTWRCISSFFFWTCWNAISSERRWDLNPGTLRMTIAMNIAIMCRSDENNQKLLMVQGNKLLPLFVVELSSDLQPSTSSTQTVIIFPQNLTMLTEENRWCSRTNSCRIDGQNITKFRHGHVWMYMTPSARLEVNSFSFLFFFVNLILRTNASRYFLLFFCALAVWEKRSGKSSFEDLRSFRRVAVVGWQLELTFRASTTKGLVGQIPRQDELVLPYSLHPSGDPLIIVRRGAFLCWANKDDRSLGRLLFQAQGVDLCHLWECGCSNKNKKKLDLLQSTSCLFIRYMPWNAVCESREWKDSFCIFEPLVEQYALGVG